MRASTLSSSLQGGAGTTLTPSASGRCFPDAVSSALGERDLKNIYNCHFALDLWPPFPSEALSGSHADRRPALPGAQAQTALS